MTTIIVVIVCATSYEKVEALNAGVSKYSPLNYYSPLKKVLARLKPDVLLVQVFTNDVFEDNTATAKSLLDEYGLLKTDRYFSEKCFIHRSSVKTSMINRSGTSLNGSL